MSPTFESLDEAVAAIKADCEEQLRSMRDKLMAAEIECHLCKQQMEAAVVERDRYLRIAERLVTKFAVCEAVLAEAKDFALNCAEIGQAVDQELKTAVPANEFEPLDSVAPGV